MQATVILKVDCHGEAAKPPLNVGGSNVSVICWFRLMSAKEQLLRGCFVDDLTLPWNERCASHPAKAMTEIRAAGIFKWHLTPELSRAAT